MGRIATRGRDRPVAASELGVEGGDGGQELVGAQERDRSAHRAESSDDPATEPSASRESRRRNEPLEPARAQPRAWTAKRHNRRRSGASSARWRASRDK